MFFHYYFNSLKAILLNLELWHKILVPLFAPIIATLASIGFTMWFFNFKEKKKKKNYALNLLKEKRIILDTTQLAYFLLLRSSNLISETINDISFEKFKNIPLTIFTNDPLNLLNQINKHNYDLVFKRSEFKDNKKLEIYANFLTSRTVLLELQKKLEIWGSSYMIQKRKIATEFENSYLKYFNFIELMINNNKLNEIEKSYYSNFLELAEEYAKNDDIYNNLSEAFYIKIIKNKFENKLKDKELFFRNIELNDISLELDQKLNAIKRFCEQNESFLKHYLNNHNEHLNSIKIFHEEFNKK